MARSSLAYIPGFSVKFFFQPTYTIISYFDIKKIALKSSAWKLELKRFLVSPFSKLYVTPPFTIKFRSQIEN